MDVMQMLERGWVVTLASLFGAGVLTSLTPCVYPLIPITVSVFGARAARGKLHAFALSVTYALGIAFTYTILGVVAALSGAAFGSYLGSPVVIGIIAVLFGALALSMAGLYEISPPAPVLGRLSAVGGAGFVGAFAMGLVGGFVAAPCTGPVLAGVLTWVATTRSAVAGAAMLFTYAMGIGLLFIVIGTFSGLASSLPRSGAWMEVVRSVFAAVMFAAAMYFVRNVYPALGRPFEMPAQGIAIAAILFAAGAAAGGLHLDVAGSAWTRKGRKAVASLAAGAGLFGFIVALTGGPLPSPAWVTGEPAGMAQAKAGGRPAILDFYADWCVACKELDHKTWSDARVIAESKRFVMIKIDATSLSDEVQAVQDRYGVPGLPAVIFVEPGGARRADLRSDGFIPPGEMLRRMKAVR